METKQYNNTELKAFETELLPYWETRTLTGGHVVKICNYKNYYKDKKIMVYYPEQRDWGIIDMRIKDYQETEDKIMQLSKLKGRREYARTKQTASLEDAI